MNNSQKVKHSWFWKLLHRRALLVAAHECEVLAWTNKNTQSLGPEYNCIQCSEKIKELLK